MIRCGFFNSIENDRRYDAEDMGKIFEGIIKDGVFGTMDNEKFKIQAINNTMNVAVLSGKCWFNGKYFEIVKNTSETLTIGVGENNPRYDAIYIKIDNIQNEGGRVGTLEVQPGEANATPTKPVVESTDNITNIVIGYVLVPAMAVTLNNATIESNVGVTDENEPNLCPLAEVTLDPRRGIFAYEEAIPDVDITFNDVKKYNFDIPFNKQVTFDNGTKIRKRYCEYELSLSDLGLTQYDPSKVTLICRLTGIYLTVGGTKNPIYAHVVNNDFVLLSPTIFYNETSNKFILHSALHGSSTSSASTSNPAFIYNNVGATVNITVDVIVIEKKVISNE